MCVGGCEPARIGRFDYTPQLQLKSIEQRPGCGVRVALNLIVVVKNIGELLERCPSYGGLVSCTLIAIFLGANSWSVTPFNLNEPNK